MRRNRTAKIQIFDPKIVGISRLYTYIVLVIDCQPQKWLYWRAGGVCLSVSLKRRKNNWITRNGFYFNSNENGLKPKISIIIICTKLLSAGRVSYVPVIRYFDVFREEQTIIGIIKQILFGTAVMISYANFDATLRAVHSRCNAAWRKVLRRRTTFALCVIIVLLLAIFDVSTGARVTKTKSRHAHPAYTRRRCGGYFSDPQIDHGQSTLHFISTVCRLLEIVREAGANLNRTCHP